MVIRVGGVLPFPRGRPPPDGDDEDEVEIVKNLSGDEVDPGLIIAGGRASRRGRAQFASGGGGGGAAAASAATATANKYATAAPPSDDDSW